MLSVAGTRRLAIFNSGHSRCRLLVAVVFEPGGLLRMYQRTRVYWKGVLVEWVVFGYIIVLGILLNFPTTRVWYLDPTSQGKKYHGHL